MGGDSATSTAPVGKSQTPCPCIRAASNCVWNRTRLAAVRVNSIVDAEERFLRLHVEHLHVRSGLDERREGRCAKSGS